MVLDIVLQLCPDFAIFSIHVFLLNRSRRQFDTSFRQLSFCLPKI